MDRQEDPSVTLAWRRETIRGALKLFRVTMDAVRRHAEWTEAHLGLTPAQLWAIWELRQSPGLRVVDLAKLMAVHRLTAEGLLQGLMAGGLVVCRGEDDAPPVHHFLSEAGQRVADKLPEHGQGVLKAALEQLPDVALEQLVSAMRPVVESLPMREDRAALQPMGDLLRQHGLAHFDVRKRSGA
ncbi:MAG: MarR family winged helix-turn-helix transcriptional regulator [Pseudomonadota bacterium]